MFKVQDQNNSERGTWNIEPGLKDMLDALKRHWPEYLIEGTCLGLFMISAFTFGTILTRPRPFIK